MTSHPASQSPTPPLVPSLSDRQRLPRLYPCRLDLAVQLETPASLVSLSGCLPADAQCSADLGPRRPVTTRSAGPQVDRFADCLSGVSCFLEGSQRPLWATPGQLQPPDRGSGQPSRRRALAAAHDNGSCRRSVVNDRLIAKTRIHVGNPESICDTAFPSGAPVGPRPLISSCISAERGESGSAFTETEWSRSAPTLGTVDDIRGN